MKITALATLALSVALAQPVSAEQCTFDQKGVASALRKIARQNPGFRAVKGEPAVEWHQSRGTTVKLSYGGCVDLGAEVLVRSRPDHKNPPTVTELIAVVGRYWSHSSATAVRSALAEANVVRRTEGDLTVIEVPGDVSTAFPLGFTIYLSKHNASLSWQIE